MATIKGKWKWNFPQSVSMEKVLDVQNALVSFVSGGVEFNSISIRWSVGINEIYYDSICIRRSVWNDDLQQGVPTPIEEKYLIMDFGTDEQEIDDMAYEFIVANAQYQPTIAEKLAIIAENVQKVYDAGYGNGYEEGRGGQYELIEEFTLDEDVARVDRSFDTNGEAYNFSAIKIAVKAPIAETATHSSHQLIFVVPDLKNGGSHIYHQVNGALSASGAKNTYFTARNDHGMTEYYIVPCNPGGVGQWVSKDPWCWKPWGNVEKFVLQTYPTSVLIPAGTVITIYAIRG